MLVLIIGHIHPIPSAAPAACHEYLALPMTWASLACLCRIACAVVSRASHLDELLKGVASGLAVLQLSGQLLGLRVQLHRTLCTALCCLLQMCQLLLQPGSLAPLFAQALLGLRWKHHTCLCRTSIPYTIITRKDTQQYSKFRHSEGLRRNVLHGAERVGSHHPARAS